VFRNIHEIENDTVPDGQRLLFFDRLDLFAAVKTLIGNPQTHTLFIDYQ